MRTAIFAFVFLFCLLGLGWAIERNQQFEDRAQEGHRLLKRSGPVGFPENIALPQSIQSYGEQTGAAQVPAQWVELHQEGVMRLEEKWLPFTARHTARLDQPGFVWQAEMEMLPGLPVKVVDAYVEGRGRLEARIGGFLTVAEAQGESISLGQLYRYYAEIPWGPQALWQQTGGQWSPAPKGWRLNFSDQQHRGQIVFQLDAQGRLAEIRALRPNHETGQDQIWVGRFSDYRRFEGVLLPASGEVGWVIDGEERLYWKGRIISVKFGP